MPRKTSSRKPRPWNVSSPVSSRAVGKPKLGAKRFSDVYIKSLDTYFKRFNQTFGSREIGTITKEEIIKYLKTVSANPRTRLNHLITLKTLWRWCPKPTDHGTATLPPTIGLTGPELIDLDRGSESSTRKTFSCDDLYRLLAGAPNFLLCYLVLGAFTGVREAERRRLEWCDFDLKDNALNLPKHKTKTKRCRSAGTERLVNKWLSPWVEEPNEKIVRVNRPAIDVLRLKIKVGVTWARNGLRVGFVAAHLKLFKNAPLTASICGHSVEMLEGVYLTLTSLDEAQRWFATTPEAVVAFAKAKGLPEPMWADRYGLAT